MRREQQVLEDIETLQRRLRSPTQGLYGWRAVVRSRRGGGGTDHLQFHQGPKEGPARRHYHKSIARPGLIAEHLRAFCVKDARRRARSLLLLLKPMGREF